MVVGQLYCDVFVVFVFDVDELCGEFEVNVVVGQCLLDDCVDVFVFVYCDVWCIVDECNCVVELLKCLCYFEFDIIVVDDNQMFGKCCQL